MSDFDKKWVGYLLVVLAITFLAGRAVYWTLTTVFGETIIDESGKAMTQVSGVIDTIRSLATPVLMAGGVLITTMAYGKHRDNDVE